MHALKASINQILNESLLKKCVTKRKLEIQLSFLHFIPKVLFFPKLLSLICGSNFQTEHFNVNINMKF